MASQLNYLSASVPVRHPRVEVTGVTYVSMPGESAFILNLSEDGMAVQAMEVLEAGRSLSFMFPLPDGAKHVCGVATVIWSDRSGRAGMKFTDLSEFDRFQLRRWVAQRVS